MVWKQGRAMAFLQSPLDVGWNIALFYRVHAFLGLQLDSVVPFYRELCWMEELKMETWQGSQPLIMSSWICQSLGSLQAKLTTLQLPYRFRCMRLEITTEWNIACGLPRLSCARMWSLYY